MTVNAAPECVLGFDCGGTKTLMGVASRHDGALLEVVRLETRDYPDAAHLVAAAVAYAQTWQQRHRVVAVGAATMGVEAGGQVALAPNFPGWTEAPLSRAVLETAFPGIPVRVANDVKSACLAEMRWGRLQGAAYGAYLNLGTGVGLAFGEGGRVWQGTHQMAGEVAYAWEPGDPGIALGHAPLEDRFGGPVMVDLSAAAWAERVARLGWWVGQWLLLLDVDRLVLGGGWAHRVVPHVPRWRDAWAPYLPTVPEVELSAWPDRGGLLGAVALATEACL